MINVNKSSVHKATEDENYNVLNDNKLNESTKRLISLAVSKVLWNTTNLGTVGKTKKLENDTNEGELKANYSQPAIVAFTINT